MDGGNNQPSADQQTKCYNYNNYHKGEYWYKNGKGTRGRQNQRYDFSKKEVENLKRLSQVEVSDNEICNSTSWKHGLKKEEQIYICMITNNNPMDSDLESDLKGKELQQLKKKAILSCKKMQQI